MGVGFRRLVAAAFSLPGRFSIKDGLGLREIVKLVLTRDAEVSGQSKAKRKARQLVVVGVVECGQQNLPCAALVVVIRDLHGEVGGEGVGVEVGDGAKNNTKLGGGEGLRRVLQDALEGLLPLLAKLIPALVFGFLLLSFALNLLTAFLGAALPLQPGAPFCAARRRLRAVLLLPGSSSSAAEVMIGMGFSCSFRATRAAVRGLWTGQLSSVQTVRVVPTRLP